MAPESTARTGENHMTKMQTLVSEILEPFVEGSSSSEATLGRLTHYLEFLRNRNREMNLTGYRDPNEMAMQVVGDALAPLQQAPEDFPGDDGPSELIDVGSGNGMPGMVYAIYWPECEVTLLEANKKKVEFLRDTIEELEMDNVRVLEGRAETLAHELAYREGFEMVVSRGVAPLPISLELSLPFLALNGYMLTFKGPSPQEEVKEAEFALGKLGGGKIASKAYTLGHGIGRRHALWIPKKGLTPDKYPRREGIPAKRPLRSSR